MEGQENERQDLLDLQEFDEEALKKESEELLEMHFLTGENARFRRTEGGFVALTILDAGEKAPREGEDSREEECPMEREHSTEKEHSMEEEHSTERNGNSGRRCSSSASRAR